MTEEKILAKVNEICKDKFIVKGIHNVNHALGHPYTIGPKHIQYASILNESAIESMEKVKGPSCAHLGCNRYYHEHTSDKVMFLQLLRNLTNKEASEVLFALKTEFEAEKFTGFGFVDTPEKYRIEEPIN